MRAGSWILNDLPELLVDDWYSMLIHTEFDMQMASYHYLRVAHGDSDTWRFREQPHMTADCGNVKPDIVIHEGTVAYDAIEMKCQLDGFSWSRLGKTSRS